MKRFLLLLLGSTVFVAASAAAQEPVPGGTPPQPPTPAPETTEPDGPQAAPDEAPSAPSPEPQKPPQKPIFFRTDGAFMTRKLFVLPTTGADLGLGVGPQPSKHFAIWVTPRLYLGSTANGLSVWSFRLGAEPEAVLDRFRIGGGVSLMTIGVHRYARSETLLSWGVEGRVAARADVVKSDDFALFLRASLDAGYEIYDGSIFWGPSIGAGVDLLVHGKRHE